MQFDQLKRREVITLLGGAAAWPLAAQAQQPAQRPIIGYLGVATLSAESQRVAAFMQRLHQLGWIEGNNIAVEFRWAEGRTERAAEIAAEFVRLKVDIVVTAGNSQVLALKQATRTIPIIFAVAGDPLGGGLVDSLARPGGNVTGLSVLQIDLASKRLEILREIVPSLRRLAIMGNFSNPVLGLELREVQAAARRLGVETVTLEIRRAEDIGPAFDALKGGAEALYLSPDILIVANKARINILALVARLPSIYNSREYVEEGGLGVVWSRLCRLVPSCRRICRQDFARSERGRHPGRATGQTLFRREPHHRQGAWPGRAAKAARARR